mmetsp:Transcript_8515/g.21959  ORF Transcript_8515/g.21959 Transcript_8515/m.21959 type:complete len:727 (+) Transcript_8515:77-2257(+)
MEAAAATTLRTRGGAAGEASVRPRGEEGGLLAARLRQVDPERGSIRGRKCPGGRSLLPPCRSRLLFLLCVASVMLVMLAPTPVAAAHGGLTRRKEVREMTCKEWDAYTRSVNELRRSGIWESFSTLHTDPEVWEVAHSDSGGATLAFLPWHRVFLHRMERELQKIDPDVALPYWNWALDSETPLASPILSDMFFGNTGDPENDYCISDGAFTQSATSCIRRAIHQNPGGFLTLVNIKELLLESPNYGVFSHRMENGAGMHGFVHMFLGGDMANLASPNDPLFYAHHAHIDRVWWTWQRMHDSLGAPSYKGDETLPMYPFDEAPRDSFSAEAMGYTYSNPLENEDGDEEFNQPCFVEKGSKADVVKIGEMVWNKLPNNLTELSRIPRKSDLPNSSLWTAWLDLKETQKNSLTMEDVERDLGSWARLAGAPTLSTHQVREYGEDYGFGIPIRLLLGDDPVLGGEGQQNVCLLEPDCGNCMSSLEDADSSTCVERFPTSYTPALESLLVSEYKRIQAILEEGSSNETDQGQDEVKTTSILSTVLNETFQSLEERESIEEKVEFVLRKAGVADVVIAGENSEDGDANANAPAENSVAAFYAADLGDLGLWGSESNDATSSSDDDEDSEESRIESLTKAALGSVLLDEDDDDDIGDRNALSRFLSKVADEGKSAASWLSSAASSGKEFSSYFKDGIGSIGSLGQVTEEVRSSLRDKASWFSDGDDDGDDDD